VLLAPLQQLQQPPQQQVIPIPPLQQLVPQPISVQALQLMLLPQLGSVQTQQRM
jgi:hypothetical protein